LIRLHPQPAPDDLFRYYPRQYWFAPRGGLADRLEDAYRRIVLRDHVSFVDRAIRESGESGPVLDAGCGGGLFGRLLAERGHPAVGLDSSLDAARVAWDQNRVPTICAALDQSPVAPQSCAAVTMFHVLEHLHEPARYIEAAREILKPNGRLIVQVPNAASWQFRLFGSAWNGVDVPRHLVDFKASDLDRLLTKCGFEVLRHKYFSLRDNPAGLATTLVPGLDPMARRVRPGSNSARPQLAMDLLYFTLVAASVPFTLFEAWCHAGSTVMVEARKQR
jgi:SAM-dependent methyltransferase